MSDEYIELKRADDKVLKYLATHGMSTQYQMSKRKSIKNQMSKDKNEDKVAWSVVSESVKRLAKNKYIELKKQEPFKKIKGRSKKYYGLTFKGLICVLKKGFIKPSQAHDARIKNSIPLPQIHKFAFAKGFILLRGKSEKEILESYKNYLKIIESIEREFPETFYEALLKVDAPLTRQIIELFGIEDAEALLIAFSSSLIIFILSSHEDYCKKYLKNGILYLPDNTVIGEFSKIEASRSFFFEFLQKILGENHLKGLLNYLSKNIKPKINV